MKFLGKPLDIPNATTATEAVRRSVTDALGTRVTTLEGAVGSAAGLKVTSQSGTSYNAMANDFVQANAASNPITVNLPSSPATNTVVAVKKIDSTGNIVTVTAASTVIEGDTTCTLERQGVAAGFIYDGSVWRIYYTTTFDTALSLTWRDAYNAATAYSVNDVVSYQGGSYVAKTATTGTAPTAGSTTATWGLLSLKGTDGAAGTFMSTFQNAWTAQSYVMGQIVTHNGGTWLSNAATVAGDVPGVSSKWTALAVKGTDGAAGAAGPGFAAGGSYVTGTNAVASQTLRKSSTADYATTWTWQTLPTFVDYTAMTTTITSPTVGTRAVTVDTGTTWTWMLINGTGYWTYEAGRLVCAMVATVPTTQNISASGTAVQFDSELMNVFSLWSSSAKANVVIKVPGWYELTGGVALATNAGTTQIYYTRQGTAIQSSLVQHAATTNAAYISGKTVHTWANVNDVLSLWAVGTNGTTIPANTGATTRPHFTVTYKGPLPYGG